MSDPQAVLYCLTSPSGKAYYGLTKNFVGRMKAHAHYAKTGKYALANAIRKYGFDKFTKEVVCEGPLPIIKQLEVSAISVANTLAPHGYNLTHGGDGTSGYVHTLEERARRSERATAACTEFMRSMGHANKGRIRSAATREKLSEAARRRSPELVASKVSALHSAASLEKKQVWWASERLKELGRVTGKRLGNLPNATKNTCWINKAGANRRIPVGDKLTEYLRDGWILGQAKRHSSP